MLGEQNPLSSLVELTPSHRVTHKNMGIINIQMMMS